MIDDDWHNETPATRYWRKEARWWAAAFWAATPSAALVGLAVGWGIFG